MLLGQGLHGLAEDIGVAGEEFSTSRAPRAPVRWCA
jgi:hypothetical protein